MKTAAALAREIWSEYYAPIIGLDQVEYMLDKFQSVEAISEQIATSDYWYFLIRDENRAVGYMGLQRRQETLFLSKLYLKKSARGRGLGRRAVDFVLEFAGHHGLSTIHLTVNKRNALAIAAYQRAGFTRTGEIVIDIGGGYFMDDYVLEFKL